MIHLLTLPFRILFSVLCFILALPLTLLFLPFLLLRFLFKTAVFLLVLPFAIVGMLIAIAVAVSFVVFVPIIPFVLVALLLWALVRAASQPSTAIARRV